jgi:DNA-binding CsgD family transcriptional regulator
VALFSHREFADALALVNAATLLVDRSSPFGRPFLELLARLVPGAVVGYREREVATHRLLVRCDTATSRPPPEVVRAAARLCDQHPLGVSQRARERRALRLSDVVAPGVLHRSAYYAEVLAPMGVEHQVRLWLPAPTGVARYLFVNRGAEEEDFGAHHCELLELLRPSLTTARARWEREGRSAADGLTRRESEVLTWVARGLTNREIADALVVSPGTVRKHLENSFEKLGVHSRAEAVAHLLAPRPVAPGAGAGTAASESPVSR